MRLKGHWRQTGTPKAHLLFPRPSRVAMTPMPTFFFLPCALLFPDSLPSLPSSRTCLSTLQTAPPQRPLTNRSRCWMSPVKLQGPTVRPAAPSESSDCGQSESPHIHLPLSVRASISHPPAHKPPPGKQIAAQVPSCQPTGSTVLQRCNGEYLRKILRRFSSVDRDDHMGSSPQGRQTACRDNLAHQNLSPRKPW